jgi:hypothetical protein
MTEKNEGQQSQQAQGQTEQKDEQSVLEEQRLANLKASGQLQEGEETQAQGQQEGGTK